jgi:hypothetical protein
MKKVTTIPAMSARKPEKTQPTPGNILDDLRIELHREEVYRQREQQIV